jgi:hypothetical protein
MFKRKRKLKTSDIQNITNLVCAIIPKYPISTNKVTNGVDVGSLAKNTRNIVCLAKQLYTLINKDNIDDSKNQSKN